LIAGFKADDERCHVFGQNRPAKQIALSIGAALALDLGKLVGILHALRRGLPAVVSLPSARAKPVTAPMIAAAPGLTMLQLQGHF
jgi:hypothetical protein